MQKEYVRIVEGVYRIGHTRISLDSLVYLFREGMSAESMVESYPALSLERDRPISCGWAARGGFAAQTIQVGQCGIDR
jgi:hypothetical protein